MPIYEYECKKCQTRFQVLKSISRKDEPEKCPQCGNIVTERLISQFIGKTSVCSPVTTGG